VPLELGDRSLVQIDLPTEGEWVRVKRAISKYDEREVAMRANARAKTLGIDVDTSDALFAVELSYATLVVVLKQWSFPDPITPETVRSLDDAAQTVVFDRLLELYPQPRTDDDRKNSLEGGAPPSEVEEPTLASSVGSQ